MVFLLSCLSRSILIILTRPPARIPHHPYTTKESGRVLSFALSDSTSETFQGPPVEWSIPLAPDTYICTKRGFVCVRLFFCVWEGVDLQPLLDFPSSIGRTPETKKKVNFLIKPHPISKSFLISLNMSNIRRERVTDEKTVRQTPE